MAPTQLQSTGACPGGPVLIGLTPGNEQLAHQLLADYGRKIAITVGLTTYAGSPGRSPRCGMLPSSASLPVGLHLVLQLKHNSVRSGAAFSATVISTSTAKPLHNGHGAAPRCCRGASRDTPV